MIEKLTEELDLPCKGIISQHRVQPDVWENRRSKWLALQGRNSNLIKSNLSGKVLRTDLHTEAFHQLGPVFECDGDKVKKKALGI